MATTPPVLTPKTLSGAAMGSGCTGGVPTCSPRAHPRCFDSNTSQEEPDPRCSNPQGVSLTEEGLPAQPEDELGTYPRSWGSGPNSEILLRRKLGSFLC